MIWVTGSSRSCFFWLNRISPSSAAKNIISLSLVLTIWWCPCLESSLVLLEESVCCDQCLLLDVRWSLIAALTCISLMTNDVRHIFMRLLGICLFSLGKYLFRSFAHFFLFYFFLNYENITHLQETWKIQSEFTYSSTLYYNFFLSR